MEKIAFFVEGYTEQELIKQLAINIYGIGNLSYSLYLLRGTNLKPKIIKVEDYFCANGNPKYQINIYDCNGFSTIKSKINDQRNSLFNSGFNKIIALRDVDPDLRSDIPMLKLELPYRMAQKPIPTKFLLCIMETEAWFMADTKHFLKISPLLTVDHIRTNLGLDLQTCDFETLNKPSKLLDDIYKLAGQRYEKKIDVIKKTILSLDFNDLCLVYGINIPSLKILLAEF